MGFRKERRNRKMAMAIILYLKVANYVIYR